MLDWETIDKHVESEPRWLSVMGLVAFSVMVVDKLAEATSSRGNWTDWLAVLLFAFLAVLNGVFAWRWRAMRRADPPSVGPTP